MLQSTTPDGNAPLSYNGTLAIVFLSCSLAIAWAIWNWLQIRKIDTRGGQSINSSLNENENMGRLNDIADKISTGSIQFLKQQYLICLIFVLVMFFVIYGAVEKFKTAYVALAFAFGAIASIVCGIIGILVSTEANYKTAYVAKISLQEAFKLSYRGGTIIGFSLIGIELFVLTILIVIFKSMKLKSNTPQEIGSLFQGIAGYAFGASTVALFSRIGGGIFTKAADLGADLIGKLEHKLPEDSSKNPAVIADHVGDNVGDIVGMNADLFALLSEAICAALIIGSSSLIGTDQHGQIRFDVVLQNLFLPLVSISFGIMCCILTSIIGTEVFKVDVEDKVSKNVQTQNIVSTLLLVMFLSLSAYICLPAEFQIIPHYLSRTPGYAYSCLLFGLLSGQIIGFSTKYVTSSDHFPVQEVAESSKISTATNIIYGLALGYLSTVIPAIFIAVSALLSNYWLGYYGVSLAAIGMMSNLPIILALDSYGAICDNAKGIAQMSEFAQISCQRLAVLDHEASSVEAVGKGYSMGCAGLVGFALYGAFIQNGHLNSNPNKIFITSKSVFPGLILGAMIPYVFSAFVMRGVGQTALRLLDEIKRQFNQIPGILEGKNEPDYRACIRIISRDSLIRIAFPGLLMIIVPILLGISFGPKIIAGYILGCIISGLHFAISAVNSGGAWDNAKKYIEAGSMQNDQGQVIQKFSQQHKASVLGDAVGDPMKDAVGPGLNILITFSGILCVIFADIFFRIHT